MNRKSLVGAAVGILGVIIVIVAILPGSGLLQNILPEGIQLPGSLDTIASDIKPLDVKLNQISILEISEKETTLELKFDVSNPNDKTLLLEMISYQVHENGVKVGNGEVGERLAGQLASSNYFTVLSGNPLKITDKLTIKNTGKNPEFWSTLQNGIPKWRVSGEAFYTTTSAFSGIAGSVLFDSSK